MTTADATVIADIIMGAVILENVGIANNSYT